MPTEQPMNPADYPLTEDADGNMHGAQVTDDGSEGTDTDELVP